MRGIVITFAVLGLLVTAASVHAQAADDLAWVPADAPGFVMVRVADLWKHEATKELRMLLAKMHPNLDKDVEKNIGVNLKEVERVILIVPPTGLATFVLTTAEPAREKLVATLVPGAIERKHRGKSYHESDSGAWALYAVGERMFVIGPPKSVLELVDRAETPKADGPLAEALKLATRKTPFVACLNVTRLVKDTAIKLPPQVEAALPLFEANLALVTVVSDSDTRVTIRLTCASDADAKKKSQTLRTALDILRQFIPIGRTELAKNPTEQEAEKWLLEQADMFLRDLEDGCKAATVEAKGRVVHGQMRVKTGVGTLLTVAVGVISKFEPTTLKGPTAIKRVR